MTNRALIDYCNMDRYDCIDCPYNHKECDQFIKEVGYSPWSYTGKDEDFLSREVGETE